MLINQLTASDNCSRMETVIKHIPIKAGEEFIRPGSKTNKITV